MRPLTYACGVQVHRATKLPLFSLATTRIPRGSTVVARSRPPDVSGVNSLLANRLRLIHRAALLRKNSDTVSINGRSEYKKDYDRHVRFYLRFAAGEYVFVERPPLMASSSDRLAFEAHSKLFLPPHKTIPGCQHRIPVIKDR